MVQGGKEIRDGGGGKGRKSSNGKPVAHLKLEDSGGMPPHHKIFPCGAFSDQKLSQQYKLPMIMREGGGEGAKNSPDSPSHICLLQLFGYYLRSGGQENIVGVGI